MSSDAAPAPTRHAPLALWRAAQAFLLAIHALFGAPQEIAARHTLTGKVHGQLAAWLRCAEAMLRRLLLIEASAYPRPNTRPLLRPAKLFGRKRARTPHAFCADNPDAWRVRFRCFHTHRAARTKHNTAKEVAAPADKIRAFVFHDAPPQARALSPSKGGAGLRQAQASQRRPPILRQDRPWVHAKAPLAFRSAWPLAERYEALCRVFNDPTTYARRLSRRLHATPHRLGEMLRAPPDAGHRVELFDDAAIRAIAAWRPHFSSA